MQRGADLFAGPAFLQRSVDDLAHARAQLLNGGGQFDPRDRPSGEGLRCPQEFQCVVRFIAGHRAQELAQAAAVFRLALIGGQRQGETR